MKEVEIEATVRQNTLQALMGEAAFVRWLSRLVVDIGLFDREYGNAENSGVRLVAKALWDSVVLDESILESAKANFEREVNNYYRERSKNGR